MKNNNTILPDRWYDVMKWVVMILMPAITWLIGQIGVDLGIADVSKVTHILTSVTLFMGALIGLSTLQYNKK